MKLFWIFLLFLSSCNHYVPEDPEYYNFYAHLNDKSSFNHSCEPSECFLIILVDARHLDYCNTDSLLKTMVKHPSDGSKNGDVGHAWIYLQGTVDGKTTVIEGGHSGETGRFQPKYFEGVMDLIEEHDDPNPIRYLWSTQHDGFFEAGPGYHVPTYAIKVDLNEEQFKDILAFMDPENYLYIQYSLTTHQCCTFVQKIAQISGLSLEYKITFPIQQKVTFCGTTMQLWKDDAFSQITLGSPDVLEKSLMQCVAEGKAEYALDFYKKVSGLSEIH